MHLTRRHLQVALGALWLLDGVLQCQPFMFSHSFAQQILAPAASGQPGVLASLTHLAVRAVSSVPALANGVCALVQLLLGGGLITRRWSRVALATSIVWATVVWIAGEGLGGVFSGATLLSGAPGAALLYAVIGLLAWPTPTHPAGDAPSRWALPVWCGAWAVGAGLQVTSGNNSSASFTMMLHDAQTAAPRWIALIDRHLGRLTVPSWTAGALAALDILVAVWALVPGRARQISLTLGVVLSSVGWVLFQGLGDLSSGQATDPNSGPLFVLLALAVASACPFTVSPSREARAAGARTARGDRPWSTRGVPRALLRPVPAEGPSRSRIVGTAPTPRSVHHASSVIRDGEHAEYPLETGAR